MNNLLSIHWILIGSIWYFGSGALHDVFVIRQHQGGYNRELLRLLMDGHVLMLSGIILFVCYLMMLGKIQYGALIAIVLAVAMIVYCLMIYPFLKSFGTMGISAIIILVSIRAFLVFPGLHELMPK